MSPALTHALRSGATLLALTILAVALAIGLQVGFLAFKLPVSITAIVQDMVHRTQHVRPADTVPSHFRVATPAESGPAVLAYLLSRIGETVTRESLRDRAGGNGAPASPADLVDAAMAAGYPLTLNRASYDQLPNEHGLPVIARLTPGHYVVVHKARDTAELFDPKVGRVVTVGRDAFEALWRGEVLQLNFTDVGQPT